MFNVLNMSGFNLTFFEENEDAEEESGSESADEGPPEKSQKTAKKVYAQQFRHQWLEDPEFKDWLVRPRPGENACSCKLCNKSVSCRKTALRRHTQSAQHKRALSEIAAGQRQGNLVECLQRQNEITTYKETTEARMCSFLAQHNLPLSLINNLMSLFKSVAPKNGKEVEILKGIHLSSTRCTNIIRQGVGLYFQMELVEILRKSKSYFSIIPDETTDVSTEKQLGICVVYFDESDMKIVTRFFDMVSVVDSTANGLYQAIKNAFNEKAIPMENIIGYSSDTTNVMFGEQHSVVSLLKQDVPHVLAVKCSCHLIHLCSSYACQKLSTSLEDLCRNVYSHFSRSSLRQKEYQQFQEFVEAEPHKLLCLAQTRWLSLESCAKRILEQWNALQLYFTSFVAEKRDPSHTTESILHALRNKYLKAQLEFLSAQLHRLNDFNTMFQTSDPVLHHLHSEVNRLLKSILSDFMKLDVVRSCDPFTVSIDDPNQMVSIDQVYLGIQATTTLYELIDGDPEAAGQRCQEVRKNCLAFMLEVVRQIRQRFKLQDSAYTLLEFLIPQNAVNCHPPTLLQLFNKFPYLSNVADKEVVDSEWRKQALEESNEIDPNESSLQFWKRRLDAHTFDGRKKYPNLKKVVGCMMSLPSSNAAVERLFSELKLVKSTMRNSLKRESLVGLIHTKEGLNVHSLSAHDLTVNRELSIQLKNVKSNATDTQANELILQQLAKP